ncbi:unnamed protein product [Ilex paraguariensis]|uniref:Uncharacterized protein n=1 Tax=Ilex paraguariensis TaxID=185542 RepID=A0ABC8SNM1_9AQUA
MALVPDFEAQGIDDLETILVPLAHHLRPMLLNSWKERRKPFLNMQLYEKALDLFEDDRSTSQYWETGGNCNMAIVAVRLGLHCVVIGHVDVLHDEGIGTVGMTDLNDNVDSSSAAYETLQCWVFVYPFHRHAICSRADFCKEPTFSWLSKLSIEVKMAIKQSKLLFSNGYGFDELSPCLIISLGQPFFFILDHGGKTRVTGTPEEQRALDKFLRMSDVLRLTSKEAESLTGIGNPILAAQELLRKRVRTKWVIVKMGAPAFKDPDKEYNGFILHKGTLLFPTSEEIDLCLQMIKLFKMSLVLA